MKTIFIQKHTLSNFNTNTTVNESKEKNSSNQWRRLFLFYFILRRKLFLIFDIFIWNFNVIKIELR